MYSIVNATSFPEPITVTGLAVSENAITILILGLVVGFWLWVGYVLWKNPPAGEALFTCPKFECGTNIYTGEKRCPQNAESVIYIRPDYEVCNSRYTCENSRTPYALLADGSTNALGVCDNQTTCRCLTTASCPRRNTAKFTTLNGSVYNGQRYLLQQTPIDFQNPNTPLALTSETAEFCSIKAEALNRVTPGGCSFDDATFLTYPAITLRGCLNQNPCLYGALALIPKDNRFNLRNITSADVLTTPISCVASASSNPCSNSATLPYWDKSYDLIRCRNFN